MGREAELDAVARLLAVEGGPAAAFLEGEAGIGKTAIWNAALALAAGNGYRGLSCRAAEAEASPPFVALRHPLDPALDDVLPPPAAPPRAPPPGGPPPDRPTPA